MFSYDSNVLKLDYFSFGKHSVCRGNCQVNVEVK